MPRLIVGQMGQVALEDPFQLKPTDSGIFGNQKLCNILLLARKQLWNSASSRQGYIPKRQNGCSQWIWLLGPGTDKQGRVYQDSTKRKSSSWSMLWEKLKSVHTLSYLFSYLKKMLLLKLYLLFYLKGLYILPFIFTVVTGQLEL